MIYSSVEQLIGHTPLLELTHIEAAYSLPARLVAKVESFNPAGSVKDRVALSMILAAEAEGKLTPGATIIEPTSGNTGIGLCAVAAARGYKAVIVMPDTMSVERRKLISAYGAKVVLTDGKKGMQGAVERANEIVQNTPNAILADQFNNPACVRAHYLTTGPEIWTQTNGETDIFVSAVGTGGTLTGTGKYLKEKNPNCQIVAVEPFDSPLLSKGYAGAHALQGIGANFVPSILDRELYSEVLTVTKEQAFETARALCQTEGLFVGITSGVNVYAALCLAMRKENAGKNIVTVLPDEGGRYLSSGLFE